MRGIVRLATDNIQCKHTQLSGRLLDPKIAAEPISEFRLQK
jgi:hypothetical protein